MSKRFLFYVIFLVSGVKAISVRELQVAPRLDMRHGRLTLDLSNKNLDSLDGLRELAGVRGVEVINLTTNVLRDINFGTLRLLICNGSGVPLTVKATSPFESEIFNRVLRIRKARPICKEVKTVEWYDIMTSKTYSVAVASGTTKFVILSDGGFRFEKGEQQAGDFTGFGSLKTVNLSGNPLSEATLKRLWRYFDGNVKIVHENYR